MPASDPTFIIAGAPRSGTTWLYQLLDRHPDVYMAKPVRPEPKFFLVDDLYAKGIDFYRDTWFAGRSGQRAAGEKTTNYLESPEAAERIHRHLPDVRLVFILREPSQRAYSNWAWSRMNGMESEDFERALALEDERERTVTERLKYARPHAYFSRGLYASMLAAYTTRFPREHILYLKFDDIVFNPAGLAARLHQFIGVEPRPSDTAGLDVVNPSEIGGDAMPDDVRHRLRARYRASIEQLVSLAGPEFSAWLQS